MSPSANRTDRSGASNPWAATAGYLGILAVLLPFIGCAFGLAAIYFAFHARHSFRTNPRASGRVRMAIGFIGGAIGAFGHGFLFLLVFTNLLD